MSNNISDSFPQTRNDVNNLKQTATDAAKDLASTASTHLNKARGQAQDLASHAQSEAYDQVGEFQGKLGDLAGAARDYVVARPLTCLGTAFLSASFSVSPGVVPANITIPAPACPAGQVGLS